VHKQLKQYGSGIEVAQNSCQQAAEAPPIQANLVPLFGLLYFCEGAVTLARPVVKGLALPFTVVSRAQDDTAAVVVAGQARVTVVGAVIEHVNASTAFAVLQDGKLAVVESSFRHNQGNPGSAVFARGRSTVCLQSSSFHNSSSSDFGGAIAVMGSSNTTVVNSRFTNCSAAKSGGAVYSIEQSRLTISNSSITASTAGSPTSPTAYGGAVFSKGLLLRISGGTQVTGNTAFGSGGGIYMSADFGTDDTVQSELQLTDDVVLSNNKADGSDMGQPSTGGGAYINSDVIFDPVLLKAVARGNTAARDEDVGTFPSKMTVLGPSTVVGYAARPDPQSGLPVTISLIGKGGFPCTGRNIEAYWLSSTDSTSRNPRRRLPADAGDASVGPASPRVPEVFGAAPKATAVTDGGGVARMLLKFQEAPGAHIILFKVAGTPPLPVDASITVHVRQCRPGEVEEAPGLCKSCQEGTYNFALGECLSCPPNAQCPGGAVVLSKPGFWQSSPQHNKAHR
jgi:predicted outer membrane repeat protein